MGLSLPWLVVLPLLAAGVTVALRRPPFGAGVSVLVGVITTALVGFLGVTVWGEEPLTQPGPWGLAWMVDGPSIVLLAVAAVVTLLVTAAAWQWPWETPAGAHRFWPLWLTGWAGINLVCISTDLLSFYVGLEALALSAVGLVALGRGGWAPAARYLRVTLMASVAWLAGIAVVFVQTGAVGLEEIGARLVDGTWSRVALALLLAAILAKAAIFPLHFWLPPAHGKAPAPVSALLSSLVAKATFLVALRVWELFEMVPREMWGTLLGVLGASGVLWGSLHALRESKLKTLIAYSTVAQLGYLFLVFPLLGAGAGQEVASAALLLLACHALAKAGMFLGAGALARAMGERSLEALRGSAEVAPMPLFVLGLAGVTLMGLPPSGAFVAKWYLLEAAFETGQFWLVGILVAGGLLAAAYVFRFLDPAFKPGETPDSIGATGRIWPAMLLVLGPFVLGPLAFVPFGLGMRVAGGGP